MTRRSWQKWPRLVAILLPTLATIGCTDPDRQTYPVHGIVRFTDGKLLREGTVEFEVIGRKKPVTATGEINPDGTFELGTHALDDGAVAGKHRVVVISDHSIGNGAERPGLIPQSALDSKYRDYATSDLEFDVRPEANNIIIEVDYATKPE